MGANIAPPVRQQNPIPQSFIDKILARSVWDLSELAGIFGLNRNTLYRYCKENKGPRWFKLNGRRRVLAEDALEWFAEFYSAE